MSVNHLTIEPSPSPDVTGYRMYYVPAGGTIFTDKDNPNDHSPFVALDTSLTYDLRTIAGLNGIDGTFEVGFTAIDDAGWESPLGGEQTVPFDFQPPEPPAGAVFSTL